MYRWLPAFQLIVPPPLHRRNFRSLMMSLARVEIWTQFLDDSPFPPEVTPLHRQRLRKATTPLHETGFYQSVGSSMGINLHAVLCKRNINFQDNQVFTGGEQFSPFPTFAPKSKNHIFTISIRCLGQTFAPMSKQHIQFSQFQLVCGVSIYFTFPTLLQSQKITFSQFQSGGGLEGGGGGVNFIILTAFSPAHCSCLHHR